MTLKRTLFYSAAALLFLLGMRLGTMAKDSKPPAASNTVPTYRVAPPRARFAPPLPPRDFPQNPVAQHAYAAAARIEPLLSQLPCDCQCGRKLGHASLLSCYQTRHAAQCTNCQKEGLFAFEQSRKGETARRIRRGIIRGAWRHVNLSKWQEPLGAKQTGARQVPEPAAQKSAQTSESGP